MEKRLIMDDTLVIEDLAAGGGKSIKRVTLNAPKALNALSLEMALRLQPQLVEWDANESVVAVFIEGAGEKAFCAGGDIVQIYRGMLAMDGSGEGDPGYPDAFFESEYRLDYTLHHMTTPVVTWGDGIAMGGGLGIFTAGSHRVATENARLAMPEITIGLFPDVGGTWFLNRMPGRMGLFLGLTGTQLNAGDAQFTGLADIFLPAAARDAVLDALADTDDWGDPQHSVDQALRQASDDADEGPASQLRQHRERIDAITDAATLDEIVTAVRSLEDEDDKWLARAGQTMGRGCPVTAHLIYRQIREGGDLSLRECFQRELIMAQQCIRHPDFREGVRALLIEKDGQPDWRYKTVAEVPADYVDAHFSPPWDGPHPLADLP